MEGLVALIGITLVNIDLCCIAYLVKLGIKAVFKLLELKEFFDNE